MANKLVNILYNIHTHLKDNHHQEACIRGSNNVKKHATYTTIVIIRHPSPSGYSCPSSEKNKYKNDISNNNIMHSS